MIPDADDFGFPTAPVETEPVQDSGHEIGHRLRMERLPLFRRREVYATPFGKDALAGVGSRRTERRNASGRKIHRGLKVFPSILFSFCREPPRERSDPLEDLRVQVKPLVPVFAECARRAPARRVAEGRSSLATRCR